MNKKCAQHIVQLLVKDCPIGLRSQTADGSLPIHLACQYSSDPTLLVNLLYYDKSVVNFERGDGFTPLHLGGFQLLYLIITELKSHMTCYNSTLLIG